jgi:pimeloyl-ACP methyl ester carboxylesterase
MLSDTKSQVVYILLVVFFVILVSCSVPQSTIATIQPSNTPIPPTNTLVPPTDTSIPSTDTPVPPTNTPMGPAPTPPPTARPTSEPSDTGHVERGQITSQALANNLVGDPATRDFVIYLPRGYDTSDKRYPVVYALHGFTHGLWSMVDISMDHDAMVANDEAQEMIFVFVDGSNKFNGSMYLSSPTIGDYESYIVRELVDHIDANYRTIAESDSRGIIGCSMGGRGARDLALKYPDVFGAAVSISGGYDMLADFRWDKAKAYWHTPEDFDDFSRLHWRAQQLIANAAAVASNPASPPFYLDMPLEEIDGEVRIVQDVRDRFAGFSLENYARNYLDQPLRLHGLMFYHSELEGTVPVEQARAADRLLTDLGIEHDYLEDQNRAWHCDPPDYAPVLNFLSDNLVFGQ